MWVIDESWTKKSREFERIGVCFLCACVSDWVTERTSVCVCVCRSMCANRNCVLFVFYARSNRSDDRSHTHNEKRLDFCAIRPCATTMDEHCFQLFPLSPVIRLCQLSWTGYAGPNDTQTPQCTRKWIHLNWSGVRLRRFDKYTYDEIVSKSKFNSVTVRGYGVRSNRHFGFCVNQLWTNHIFFCTDSRMHETWSKY